MCHEVNHPVLHKTPAPVPPFAAHAFVHPLTANAIDDEFGNESLHKNNLCKLRRHCSIKVATLYKIPRGEVQHEHHHRRDNRPT